MEKTKKENWHIGVVGLGYVGLTLALTLADLGFKVKGFDNDSKVRISLQKGKPHFFEHGLDDLLKSHLGNNFKVVENFKGENNSEIYFIAVGTPLDKNQKPNLIFLRKAVKDLGKVLKKGDAVVLRSTVPVGTTRSFVAPILEAESGLRAGEDFMLAFAPERTVEGKALEELRHLPQVVGGINRVSVDLTANIFRFITKSIVEVDSLEEAEMVKLVNNVHRDISFAFANELSLTCNALKIDTVRVIEAANLGYDRSQISFPSPGVGGACLSKDPYIFFESAQKANYEPLLPLKAREVNKRMSKFVAGLVVDFLKKEKNKLQNSKIFILGFTFKGRPVTSDIRYSPTLDLLKHLKKHDFSICGYDPAVSKKEIEDLKVEWTTIKKGFEKADAVLVMHNNPEFEKINLKTLAKLAAKPFLLLDTFRLYPKDEAEKIENLVYKRL